MTKLTHHTEVNKGQSLEISGHQATKDRDPACEA